MKQKLWLFLDIDGCIMDNVFANGKFYTNDMEKIDKIINAYERSRTIALYPEFIDFFKRIVNNEKYDIEEITFITGRQENVFGWLTEMQLRSLERIHWFYIKYYHNFGKHTWELYKTFKIHSVLDALQFTQFRGMIKIYDDMDFSLEFMENLDRPHEFYLINKKEDWNEID